MLGHGLVMDDEETRLISRRGLYCGVGSVIALLLALLLAFTLDLLPVDHWRFQMWGVDLKGIMIRSLFSAGLCVSTVLALRKARLVPLAVVASLLIGLVTHKVGIEFLRALYPREYMVGLGELGKFIDQHYSPVFGLDPGGLVENSLAILLIAFFCSMLSRNILASIGGFGAGLAISVITPLLSLLRPPEVLTVDSTADWFVVVTILIFRFFISGAILGSGVGFGEYLALHFPLQGTFISNHGHE